MNKRTLLQTALALSTLTAGISLALFSPSDCDKVVDANRSGHYDLPTFYTDQAYERCDAASDEPAY